MNAAVKVLILLIKIMTLLFVLSGMGGQWPSYLEKLSKLLFSAKKPEDEAVTHSRNYALCSK